MADLTDVEDGLKGLLVTATYPDGTSQPSKVPGAIPCAFMTGWPVKDQLEADMKAGVVVVSIQPRNTARRSGAASHISDWEDLANLATSITAVAGPTTITLSGSVATPQNVACIVNGVGYTYAVQPNDTLAQVATGLTALINVSNPATSAGAVITIPGAHSIEVRSATRGSVIRILRQQVIHFAVTVWAPTVDKRKAVARFLDGVMAGVGLENPRRFIAMPDGSVAQLSFIGGLPTDRDDLLGLYRRDLVYAVEYATTDVQDATPITLIQTNVSSDADGGTTPTSTQTSYS